MTLESVEDAALARAAAEAQKLRAAARARAQRNLDAARMEADALVKQRRVGAERLARSQERERIAHARNAARGRVLSARRGVMEAAAAAARAAARGLPENPRYQALLQRLEADARSRLSIAGAVEVHPILSGGFVARAGNLEIDQSLDAQLQRCLESMAVEMEHLWSAPAS